MFSNYLKYYFYLPQKVLFYFSLHIVFTFNSCGESDRKTVKGKITTENILISPIQEQEAVILGITLRTSRQGKGWSTKDSYCFLAEGAEIIIEGKSYPLVLEKDFALQKDIPLRVKSSKPLIISAEEPSIIPEKLRNFHPKIEAYIRVLRKDAPTKLTIPLLKSIELAEWYYAKDEEIKIRVKIRQDTAYFNPKSLF